MSNLTNPAPIVKASPQNGKDRAVEPTKLPDLDLETITEEIKMLKHFFDEFVNDMKSHGGFPSQILQVLIGLPTLYEKMMEAVETKWKNIVKKKDQQCCKLETKIAEQNIKIEEYNRQKLQAQVKNIEIAVKNHDECLGRQIGQIEGCMKEQKEERTQEEFIPEIEVTLREYSGETKKIQKITELPQEEYESTKDKINKNCKKTQNRAIRSSATEQIRKKANKSIKRDRSFNSFLKGAPTNRLKERQANTGRSSQSKIRSRSGSRFWKQLKGQIGSTDNSPSNLKAERSKQNCRGAVNSCQKDGFMSKVSELRKLLFLDQGIKRFGLGLH